MIIILSRLNNFKYLYVCQKQFVNQYLSFYSKYFLFNVRFNIGCVSIYFSRLIFLDGLLRHLKV